MKCQTLRLSTWQTLLGILTLAGILAGATSLLAPIRAENSTPEPYIISEWGGGAPDRAGYYVTSVRQRGSGEHLWSLVYNSQGSFSMGNDRQSCIVGDKSISIPDRSGKVYVLTQGGELAETDLSFGDLENIRLFQRCFYEHPLWKSHIAPVKGHNAEVKGASTERIMICCRCKIVAKETIPGERDKRVKDEVGDWSFVEAHLGTPCSTAVKVNGAQVATIRGTPGRDSAGKPQLENVGVSCRASDLNAWLENLDRHVSAVQSGGTVTTEKSAWGSDLATATIPNASTPPRWIAVRAWEHENKSNGYRGKVVVWLDARILAAPVEQVEPDAATWGEPVEGVRVALHAERRTWKAGETPKFTTEVSKGERKSVFGWANAICEMEFDGRWYDIGVDDHLVDRITLDESWYNKMTHAKLPLSSGKHTVRVAITGGVDGKSVRAISNPIEITIEDSGARDAGTNGRERLKTSLSPLRLLASDVKYAGADLQGPPRREPGERIVIDNVVYYRGIIESGLIAENLTTKTAKAFRMFDLALVAGWYERKKGGHLPQGIRGLYRQGNRLWMGSNGVGVLVYDTKAGTWSRYFLQDAPVPGFHVAVLHGDADYVFASYGYRKEVPAAEPSLHIYSAKHGRWLRIVAVPTRDALRLRTSEGLPLPVARGWDHRHYAERPYVPIGGHETPSLAFMDEITRRPDGSYLLHSGHPEPESSWTDLVVRKADLEAAFAEAGSFDPGKTAALREMELADEVLPLLASGQQEHVATIRGFFRPTKEEFFAEETIRVEMVVHNDGPEEFRFDKGGDYRFGNGRHDRFFVAFEGSNGKYLSAGGGLLGVGTVPANGVCRQVIDLTPWGPPRPDDQGIIRVTCRRTLSTRVATKLMVNCLERQSVDYTRKDARAVLIAQMTRLNQRRTGFVDDREKQEEIERVVDSYLRFPQIRSTFECKVKTRVRPEHETQNEKSAVSQSGD